jgi:hypothetical protein
MKMREVIGIIALLGCILLGLKLAHAAETQSGSWTIAHSNQAGKVEFGLMQSREGHHMSNESDWPVTALEGLDTTKAGRQDVHFTISRDAGRFDCEGYLNNGEGAGIFHFAPDAKFVQEMQALGFGGIDEDKQFSMAVQDVSVAFAKEMKGQHLKDLDTDKLIAFRIFNVNAEFIGGLRAEGLAVSDSDRLVAFRIHGVSPEMVRQFHQAGYKPDEDTLIALRIHGATPEFVEQLRKQGYDHIDLQQLIAFRIHGVSPDFIEKVQGLGYKHPEPDQLIAMRIHGVTPEYIEGMRAHGIQDLSIDKLISLRIQGID